MAVRRVRSKKQTERIITITCGVIVTTGMAVIKLTGWVVHKAVVTLLQQ